MPEIISTICPLCGGDLAGLHCKLVCRNCGYREDCSDLFPHATCESRAAETFVPGAKTGDTPTPRPAATGER